MTDSRATEAPKSAAEAEERAAAVRDDLARTIDQLGDKLRPSRLKDDALAAVHDRTPPWLISYWRFARSPSGLALACAIGASVASTILTRRPSHEHKHPREDGPDAYAGPPCDSRAS